MLVGPTDSKHMILKYAMQLISIVQRSSRMRIDWRHGLHYLVIVSHCDSSRGRSRCQHGRRNVYSEDERWITDSMVSLCTWQARSGNRWSYIERVAYCWFRRDFIANWKWRVCELYCRSDRYGHRTRQSWTGWICNGVSPRNSIREPRRL